MKMKKRISTILAVVLTVALLASSFAMLGVSADEPVALADQVKETVTIGNSTYTINGNEKYSAYDEVMNVINNTTIGGNGSTDGWQPIAPVSFTGAWSVNFKLPSCNDYGKRPGNAATKLEYCNTYGSTAPGLQLVSMRSNDNAHLSVGAYGRRDNTLWISPTSQEGADSRAKIAFKADRDGKVVLWDTNGRFTTLDKWGYSLKGASPYYFWQTAGTEISIYVWKNKELLWPLDGEDNVISTADVADNASAASITFPDLGEIEVATGDEIYVEFIQNNNARAGVLCAPMVAYTYEEPIIEAVPENVSVGGKTYKVNANEKYSAYDEITSVINNAAVGDTVTLDGAWDVSFGHKASPFTNALKYQSTGAGNGIQSTHSYASATWGRLSVGKFNATDLYVSPASNGAGSYAKFSFTATRDGKVVLWDKNGSLTSAGMGSSTHPYYFWNSASTVVEMAIYKNDELLWPTNSEANTFNSTGNTITFPDLGAIEVATGDEIYIKFTQPNDTARSGVRLSPMIAYTYEAPPVEVVPGTVTVGGKEYTINTNEKYSAVTEYNNAVSGLVHGNYADFSDSVFDIDFKHYASQPYGKTVNSSAAVLDLNLRYGNTNESWTSTTDATLLGLQGYHNPNSHAYYASSVLYNSGSQRLMVSPYHRGSTGNGEVDQRVKLSFTAPHDGEVLLWDNAAITKVGAGTPYWMWQNSATTISVNIYKNDTKLWPTNGEANAITSSVNSITFPNLGEIKVNAGDEIFVEFVINNQSVASVLCSPEFAYTVEAPIVTEEKEINGKTYAAIVGKDYSAVTAYNELVAGKTHGTNINFADSAWKLLFKQHVGQDYGRNASGGTYYLTYRNVNESWTSTTNATLLGIQANNGSYSHAYYASTVTYASARDRLLVSPYIRGGGAETADQRAKLYHIAERDGTIVLWDKDGVVDLGADKWGNLATMWNTYSMWMDSPTLTDGTAIEVNVLKNGEKIWPLNGEANTVSRAKTSIVFPELEIDVNEGDEIAVEFIQNNYNVRAGVFCNPQITYVHEHDFNVEVVEGNKTYYKPTTTVTTCNTCVSYENVVAQTSTAVTFYPEDAVYSALNNTLAIDFSLDQALLNDYVTSKLLGYKPTMSLLYTVGGKTYDYQLSDDIIMNATVPTTIEVAGFNADRYAAESTFQLRIDWTAKGDEYYVKQGGEWLTTDTFAEKLTITPSQANTATGEKEVAAKEAFDTLLDTVAGTESADAVVGGVTGTVDGETNKLASEKAEVNIKDASMYLQITLDSDLVSQITAKAKEGRTAKLIVTIDAQEYEVTLAKLYTRLKITLSGLSYDQMYSDVSVKVVVSYTDSTVIESSAITFDFAEVIEGVAATGENSAASALQNYMAAAANA